MKEIIYNEGQLIKERLSEISDYIYRNPELGNEEYKAILFVISNSSNLSI